MKINKNKNKVYRVHRHGPECKNGPKKKAIVNNTNSFLPPLIHPDNLIKPIQPDTFKPVQDNQSSLPQNMNTPIVSSEKQSSSAIDEMIERFQSLGN